VLSAFAVIAAVLAGLLRVHAFDVFGHTPDNYVSVALAVLGAVVGPITSGQFVAIVHVSAKVASAISFVLLVAQTLLVQIHDPKTSAILVGIVTFAAWLGFGPGTVAKVKAALAR
jgi:hypothetical protein